jgi:hypothetical protein
VGKTSVGFGTAGIELRADDSVYVTRSANTPVYVNRLSTDGDIVQFSKDGSTVGSIGVSAGGRAYIASNSGVNGSGLLLEASSVQPTDRLGGAADNTKDLGSIAHRFKDLYLGGGVFLGGTGSANKLTDYEFGNWIPAIQYQSGGPNTATQTSGSYTKIGGLVNVNGMMICGNTNSGSGLAFLAGLPFTVADVVANTSVEANGTVGYFANLGTTVNTISISAIANTSKCEIYLGTLSSGAIQGGVATFNSGAQFRFSMTYRTNS